MYLSSLLVWSMPYLSFSCCAGCERGNLTVRFRESFLLQYFYPALCFWLLNVLVKHLTSQSSPHTAALQVLLIKHNETGLVWKQRQLCEAKTRSVWHRSPCVHYFCKVSSRGHIQIPVPHYHTFLDSLPEQTEVTCSQRLISTQQFSEKYVCLKLDFTLL